MKETRSPPTIIDEPSNQMDALLTERVIRLGESAADDRIRKLVDRVVRAHLGSATTKCTAETAGRTLEQCILTITLELRTWANSETPIRWLWMLRRLPRRIFEGQLLTTIGYDRTLAEVISGRSTARTSSPRDGNDAMFSYPLSNAVIGRLARFCAGIRLLSDYHRCYRWSGKGADFNSERVARRRS